MGETPPFHSIKYCFFRVNAVPEKFTVYPFIQTYESAPHRFLMQGRSSLSKKAHCHLAIWLLIREKGMKACASTYESRSFFAANLSFTQTVTAGSPCAWRRHSSESGFEGRECCRSIHCRHIHITACCPSLSSAACRAATGFSRCRRSACRFTAFCIPRRQL